MKSRILRIIIALFLLLIVLIALLPAIMSSSPVRGLVMDKAAASAPGDLAIGSWKLTWNNGLRVEDLAYDDPAVGASITVDQITVQKGLLGLIRDHQDLGTIRVSNPVIHLAVPEAPPAPTPPTGQTDGEASPAPSPPRPTAPTTPSEPIRLPDIAVDFALDGGRIEIHAPGQTTPQVLENLHMVLAMAGASEPVTYSLEGQVAGGDGAITVKGTTTLSVDGTLEIDAISTDTTIAVSGVDLAPLTTWVGAPTVNSILTLNLQADGSLADGVRVRGNVRLPDTTISGDSLGGDQPSLGDVVVVLNATYADDRVGISNLVVRSGVARLQATGSVGTTADGSFTIDGELDLAALARELPKTLNLQEGVTLNEGALTLVGTVVHEQGTTRFDGSASIDALRGERAGEVIAWDSPTRVTVKGSHSADELVLEQCEVVSPFLTASGSGTLDALTLQVDASLGKAVEEAGKFVDLAGWSAAGDIAMSLAFTEADTAREFSCSVASPSLSVSRGDRQIVPPETMHLQLTASVMPANDTDREWIQAPVVTWQTWAGSGSARADRINLASNGELPAIQHLVTTGTIDLARVADTLHAMESLPRDVTLGGKAAFNLEGATAPNTVTVSALSITLNDLVAGGSNGAIREKQMTLAASGTGQPDDKTMQFPSISCTLEAGEVRLRNTAISGGAVATQATGNLDLKTLLTTLNDVVPLPDGTSISGLSQFEAELAMDGKNLVVSTEAGLTSLEILSAGNDPIREEKVELTVTLAMDGEKGTLTLSEASVLSTAVQLRAEAQAVTSNHVHQASASGELGLDLEKLAGYARALLGIDLEMAGQQTQPFAFASHWRDDEPKGLIRNATLTAGLHADRIEAFGLTIVDLDLPLQLADGRATLEIKGQVNNGQLAVKPVIDFTQEPAVAMLVDPTNLLSNVELTDALSEELLSKIHPLFKGASEVTGKLNLGMEEFVWPLAAEARSQARFNGWMQFTGLHMKTHGMVEKILTAMKVRERDADFGDRNLEFRCADERITCSPLRFSVDRHEVSIVGSMGLDQTLDYSAEIPVTESLVGRDVYKYLEGTTIRVPIRGTVVKPELNASVLTDAAGDLAKQAARKAITENAGKLLEGFLNK